MPNFGLFGGLTGSAQGLLLALCSGLTASSARGNHMGCGTGPAWVSCVCRKCPPRCPSLWSHTLPDCKVLPLRGSWVDRLPPGRDGPSEQLPDMEDAEIEAGPELAARSGTVLRWTKTLG